MYVSILKYHEYVLWKELNINEKIQLMGVNKHHGIPFYVAAPLSTLDSHSKNSDIVIEERGRGEVACCGGQVIIPNHVPVLNYAFDATPMSMVKAIITEKGIFYPPIDVTKVMSS
jgi:methylthioribose-1-phosphate isomerase